MRLIALSLPYIILQEWNMVKDNLVGIVVCFINIVDTPFMSGLNF